MKFCTKEICSSNSTSSESNKSYNHDENGDSEASDGDFQCESLTKSSDMNDRFQCKSVTSPSKPHLKIHRIRKYIECNIPNNLFHIPYLTIR